MFATQGIDSCCCFIGKLVNGQSANVAAEGVEFPNQAKIVDLAMAAGYTLALAENGDVYYWGKYQVQTQRCRDP